MRDLFTKDFVIVVLVWIIGALLLSMSETHQW